MKVLVNRREERSARSPMMITDEQLAEWERLATAATPGPWRWWTSNSFRRLSSDADMKDGGVLCAVVQHSDGHPDVFCSEADRAFIAAARTAVPALIEELRRLREAQTLYTEPAWLTQARAWVASFRAAVQAQELPWVAPKGDEDDAGWFHWPRRPPFALSLNRGRMTLVNNEGPWVEDDAPRDDLPACVDLYRRWLAGRSGA